MSSTAIGLLNQLNRPWEEARVALIGDLRQLQETLNTLISTNGLDTLSDVWITVPFVASTFSCNAGGSITPLNVQPFALAYKVIGSTFWYSAAVTITVNNGATTELRVSLPSGFVPMVLPSVGVVQENRLGTAALWSSGGTAGAAGVFVNIKGRYVSVQRYDGSLAAAFPAAQCTIRFTLAIPLQA